MANEKYLNDYRQFFQYFSDNLDLNDPLPVKLPRYRLVKKEVIGAIFNWTNQYLGEKRCPKYLISFLSRVVIEKTRNRCKKQPVQCGFNPSDNAYDPLKLMHTVIQVINDVCFNYKSSLDLQNTNIMAISNPLPPPETAYNVVSISSLKNSRRKMEDRLTVIYNLNEIFTKQDATPSHYFAVFDGHDGEHAAAYCSNHLHQFLAESSNFITDIEQAIKDAFFTTDSMFIDKCKFENIVGGTTAVCALLLPKENTLYVSWVGDSQAALISEGKILPCVNPHKPDREDERRRIEAEGGMVIHWGVWRVNGQLSVSRAIGDSDYKPYVTAVPDVVKISLNGSEDFFVLGSDGLWDHIDETQIARVVYDAVRTDPDKAEIVSRELVQVAKQNGSSDNISVIVVFLRDPHQIAAGPLWDERVVKMDTLDNANNPFGIPTNLTTDNDDLLIGLKKTEDVPNNDLIKMLEKSNCERVGPDFDTDDNLGPETDIDNPEDGSISPNIDVMKRQSEAMNNNFNPFNDIEKSLEINLNLKAGTFEDVTSPVVEENSPLPSNSVHNVSQLIDTGADSDSEEDEGWNYVRGEEANKENIRPTLQLNSEVAQETTEDIMSQLNPNAAEFVPVSPTHSTPSPLERVLSDEAVISRSPSKPPTSNDELDLNIPSPVEFQKDISCRPHEIEEELSNGHKEDDSLNNAQGNEFHFGPNATPFTPVKLLDYSEASSTKAVYGDDTQATFDDSDFIQKDDPMSVSFHQDRNDDSNPFDLNKVHVLPDDVDEFIAKDDTNSFMNETISDLTEHFPLGKQQEDETKIPVTDLDLEVDKDSAINSCERESDERLPSPIVAEKTMMESPSEVQDQKLLYQEELEEKEPFKSQPDEKELCSPVIEEQSETVEEVQQVEINSCDNEYHTKPVTSEPSPNNDEFVPFRSEEPTIEKAIEHFDNLLDLDPLRVTEEKVISAVTEEKVSTLVTEEKVSTDDTEEKISTPVSNDPIALEDLSGGNVDQFVMMSPKREIEENVVVTSTNLLEPNLNFIPSKEETADVQQAFEDEQPLIQCNLDNSATESVTTAEVHSFLERSIMEDVACPISPNVSTEINEAIAVPIGDQNLCSPVHETCNLPEATSTPFSSKSSASLSTQQLKTSASKSPKVQPSKEVDKKLNKSKVSSPATSTSTAKKAPTPRNSLGAVKTATPSPRPAAKLPAKPSPQSSRVTSTGKTESSISKTNVKNSTTAPKTTTTAAPRVPLSSRTTTRTTTTTTAKTLTNGDAKPASSRPGTGTIKKTTEITTTKSATGSNRATVPLKAPALPSTRVGTTTASTTKPKPSTLRAVPSKTSSATTTQKSNAVSKTTTTASRTITSGDNKDSKTALSARNLKPKPATDKQLKETVNKMTASKNTTTRVTNNIHSSTKISASKKIEEKVASSRTTMKPIRKPGSTTTTTTTKVGKPKENGVAPIVTEQIVVNNAANNEMNGINSNQQYVKDNSPIDNKLLIENPTETAAN